MDMVYTGEGDFRFKYQGRMIPVKNGTVVKGLDEKTAKELSERKVGGKSEWKAADKAPKEKKKGAE